MGTPTGAPPSALIPLFTVAGQGSLSLGSSPFFYWNTKADGTGTIFRPGANTFPLDQTTNLTLFAVWGVTTGLINSGVTKNINFFYDPSLSGTGGVEPARINQLLAAGVGGKPVIENDFDWLQAQFAGVDMTKARRWEANGGNLPDPSRDPSWPPRKSTRRRSIWTPSPDTGATATCSCAGSCRASTWMPASPR